MKTTMQITGDRNIPRLWLTVALLLISALLLSGQASRTVASGSMDAIASGSAWTDLVNGSDVIVRAHVLTTITNWEGDEIASVHLVEVHYTLLGEPPARFVVHTRGGILPNGVGMAVSNMPTLATNEEVLLFLARNPDDSYRIISDEGKLTVENGHASSVIYMQSTPLSELYPALEGADSQVDAPDNWPCLLYTSPSPRD